MGWPLNYEQIDDINAMGFVPVKLNINEMKPLGEVVKTEYEYQTGHSCFNLTIYKGDERILLVRYDPDDPGQEAFKYKGRYDLEILKRLIELNFN